jgi:hypothetical protein
MPGAHEPCPVVASHETMISAMSLPTALTGLPGVCSNRGSAKHVAPAALQITKQPGDIDYVGQFEACLNQRSAGTRARRPGPGAAVNGPDRAVRLGGADLVRHGLGATGSAAVTCRRRCSCAVFPLDGRPRRKNGE